MTDVTEKKEPTGPILSDPIQSNSAQSNPEQSNPAQPKQQPSAPAESTLKGAESGSATAKKPRAGTAEKIKPTDKTPQPPHQAGTTKGSGGTIIAIIALILVIVAAAAGYFVWQQLNQQQSALEQRLTAEEQAISGFKSSSQSDAQTLQQQMSSLSEAVNTATQHDTLLDERLSEINTRLEERRSDTWLIIEARYLINIASYQTQLNHNTKTALSALESADQRLRDIDDPSLLKARQAVTDDIAVLRAIAPVDIPGIALLLSKLEQQVATLPLADQEEQPATPADAVSSAEVSGVESFFHKVWSDIKGLVVIRHQSGPAGDALSTPDQRIYLQQNLRLKLETARLALLQRDTQTFQATITTTQAWLERYYDTGASSTSAMLTSLTPLATIELQPELPDLSNALRLIDSWQELHQANIKAGTPLNKESTGL